MAETDDYTSTAKLLHWLMAILLFAQLALGVYMHDLPLSPQKLQLYSWHKWGGVCAFVLVIVRLGWRATRRPPGLAPTMRRGKRVVARAAHLFFYLLMIATPLSGWLMSSAKGVQTVWFDVLPIPDLLEKNAHLGEVLAGVHKALNVVFVAVLAGHVGAALKHHFIDGDEILRRMLPKRSRHPFPKVAGT